MTTTRRVRVTAFGAADVLVIESAGLPAPRHGAVVVRVTHASVGATDVLARRGGYLLQPRAGFTPGYDGVGVLETGSEDAERLGLRPGMRVAFCLPRMRTHSTRLVVAPSLLVRVPDELTSPIAATAPLDLLTAGLALHLTGAQSGDWLLIQGVTGAVGSFAAQQATRAGLRIAGTASARSAESARASASVVVDYTDPDWPRVLRDAVGGRVSAAIDHTGASAVRDAVDPRGIVVRTAFTGRAGHERADTAVGGFRSSIRRWGHPRERVCSVPLFIATRRAAYRRMLDAGLADLASGALTPPEVELFPFDEVRAADERAEHPVPRRKVVLEMPPG